MTSTDIPEPILPQSSKNLIGEVCITKRHPGLQLDKLTPAVGDMESQYRAIRSAIKCEGDGSLLESLLIRRREYFDAIGASHFEMKTRGPLTLQLSRNSALENAGISLHPVYGFLYLPGSGLKGLTRAWAETVWAPRQPEAATAWKLIEQAFGWSPGSEKHKKEWRPDGTAMPEGSSAGRIVFHDAWPLQWTQIDVDIANNHHRKYYEDQDGPGDWEDPNPIYFMAIRADEHFSFALSDRHQRDDQLVELVQYWLEAALEIEGAGAKTAAGYGRFARKEGGGKPSESPLTAKFDLCLAAPAFLAGALQTEEDCNLRPATLRGLLRWWWRTMHAAHVDSVTLRRLEATIWGDTTSGAAVRLALDYKEVRLPEQHPDKKDQVFLKKHDIDKPRDRKSIQGLYYASYGMAEDGKYRWFLPDGAIWTVTLTARNGQHHPDNQATIAVSASALLEQAKAALWLLARFGGAGSRSRKGFGSFNDIEIPEFASIEDCREAAVRYRSACGANQTAKDPATPSNSPTLEDAIILEKKTPWKDPWYALEQTGITLQRFTKAREGNERIPLGLPRKTGRNSSSRALNARKGERHASPALWSLTADKGNQLTVRLIAFPAANLPDYSTSKRTLEKLVEFAETEITSKINGGSNQGRRRPTHAPAPNQSPKLQKGTFVSAKLLEERTKKGGWRARHEDSGKEMPIQNSTDVPENHQAGDIVQLYVFSNDAYKWPTSQVREQAERSRSTPAERSRPRRSPRGMGRRK